MLILGLGSSFSLADGGAFTYQGHLTDNGSPANGSYDLRFGLYGQPSGGFPLVGFVTNSAVQVTNGLLTVSIDFGVGAFDGGPRWLELGVRAHGGEADYFVLSPRQWLSPTPYAITAGQIIGPLPGAGLSGTYSNAVALSNPSNTFSGNGAELTGLNAGSLASGSVPDARLSENVALLNAVNWFTGTNTVAGVLIATNLDNDLRGNLRGNLDGSLTGSLTGPADEPGFVAVGDGRGRTTITLSGSNGVITAAGLLANLCTNAPFDGALIQVTGTNYKHVSLASLALSFANGWATNQYPPVLESVRAAPLSGTTAEVTWTTDMATTNNAVDYGITTAYGATVTVDLPATSHSNFLSGLTKGTTYRYRVRSTAVGSGLRATNADRTLTMPSACLEVYSNCVEALTYGYDYEYRLDNASPGLMFGHYPEVSGTVCQLGFYCAAVGSPQPGRYLVGIYKATANGELPDDCQLVATNVMDVTSLSTNWGWVNFPITAPLSAGAKYFVGFMLAYYPGCDANCIMVGRAVYNPFVPFSCSVARGWFPSPNWGPDPPGMWTAGYRVYYGSL
jgi:hypothetical protein